MIRTLILLLISTSCFSQQTFYERNKEIMDSIRAQKAQGFLRNDSVFAITFTGTDTTFIPRYVLGLNGATIAALDLKLAINGNGSSLTGLTKSQVGLSNADNTSDLNKPISTATQSALDAKQGTISLTTNNTSGAATFNAGVLNIPNYATGGGSPAWEDVAGKPTTIAGYAITDYLDIGESVVSFKTDFLAAATTANPPYIGAAISTGTNAANTTNMNGNRPGVVRMTSSTTANGGYRWTSDAAPIRIKGGEVFMTGIAPVNFTTTTMRAGFLDNTTSADAVDGIYFEYTTSGVIVLKTSNNSTRTTSGTITTLSLNTWYKLKITVNSNATSVLGEVFDASGTLISSQTITTNIPTTAGRETGVGIVCTESTTTATAMCDLDFIYAKLILTR